MLVVHFATLQQVLQQGEMLPAGKTASSSRPDYRLPDRDVGGPSLSAGNRVSYANLGFLDAQLPPNASAGGHRG